MHFDQQKHKSYHVSPWTTAKISRRIPMRSSLKVVFALLILLLMTCLAAATEPVPPTTNAASPSQGPYPGMVCGNADCSIRWSEKLGLKSLEEIDQRMEEKFDRPWKGYFYLHDNYDKEYTICMHNCKKMLRFSKLGAAPKTNIEYRPMLSVLSTCYSVELLKTVSEPKTDFLHDFFLDQNCINSLSPRFGLTPSVSWAKEQLIAETNGLSWKEFEPNISIEKIYANGITIINEDTHYSLFEYARGDFNHDGFQDMLIRTSLYIDNASYGAEQLFLITREHNTPETELVRIIGN